jgi:hypothetical protein
MEFFEAFGGLILVLIIVVAFYRHPIRREPDIIERQRQSLEEAVTLFTAPTDDALWKLAEQRKDPVSLKAVSDEYNRLILEKYGRKSAFSSPQRPASNAMRSRPLTYAILLGTIIVIVIVGVALGGIFGGVIAIGFWALFGMWKMRRMNNDADQQKLIALLVDAAETYQHAPQQAAMSLNAYFGLRGWSRIESGRRMAHAMSFIEHAPALRDVYPKAQVMWRAFVDGAW